MKLISIPFVILCVGLTLGGAQDLQSQESDKPANGATSRLGNLVGNRPKASPLLQQLLPPISTAAAPEVGLWTGQQGDQTFSLKLGADHRYELSINQSGQLARESGTYEFKEASLILSADGSAASEATEVAAILSGDSLTITLGGNRLALTRGFGTGIPAPAPALAEAVAPVTGIWSGQLGTAQLVFAFADEGRYQMVVGQGDQMTESNGVYRLTADSLFLKEDGSDSENVIGYRRDSPTQLTIREGEETAVLSLVEPEELTPTAPVPATPPPGGGLSINLPPPAQENPGVATQPPVQAPTVSNNPLIGLWEGVLEGTIGMTLVFVDDVSYGIRLSPQNQAAQINEGRYRVDGGVLYTLPNGNAQESAFPFQFAGADQLMINFGTGTVTLARQAQETVSSPSGTVPATTAVLPTTAAPGVIDPGLVGVWRLPEKYRVDFNSEGVADTYLDRVPSILVLTEDGGYLFGSETALQQKNEAEIEQSHWCAKDQILYLYSGVWNPVAQYQATTNQLILRGGDGVDQIFVKVKP